MQGVVDLHMHSCYSDDGEYTPSALVQMCSDAGISLMAIADHNTVAGVEEAVKKAEELQICCLSAIEIDCYFEGSSFHVLGYEIDHKSADFRAIEANVRKQCAGASKELLGLINSKMGFAVTEDELNRLSAGSYWSESWPAEAFAEVLLGRSEYLGSDILKPYRAGGARGDNPYVNFYWDHCSQGKHCYVKVDYPDMQEVIDIIHDNGGTAVLAHPGNNLKGRFEMVDRLIPLGLNGIEVCSSYHDTATSKWFYDKTVEKRLKATQGSDFHGKTKPSIKLGGYSHI